MKNRRILDIEWSLRRGEEGDAYFLVDSWMKSLNECLRGHERRSGYWSAQKLLIATLLERSTVVVACEDERPDKIVGYAVGEPGHDLALHFVYVRKKHRRAGVADAMISQLRSQARPGGDVVVTHMTYEWVLKKCKKRHWGYAPRGVFYRLIDELSKGKAA